MIIKMPDASAITRLRLANAVVTGNRNSQRASSLQGLFKKKLEIYGNAYKTTASGGAGSCVGAYAYVYCQGCPSFSPPTGYLNSDGTFTYAYGGGAMIFPSSNVVKITSSGTPSDKDLSIYYNCLNSGATYTVTFNDETYVLPPGTFF